MDFNSDFLWITVMIMAVVYYFDCSCDIVFWFEIRTVVVGRNRRSACVCVGNEPLTFSVAIGYDATRVGGKTGQCLNLFGDQVQ